MLHRLKFHLKPLVDEMLDQLPPEVFTSDKTTFLDPAMAGGQFLREVITRLRAAGHSDDNIRSRIWGCEILNGRLNYCRRFGGVISDHLIQTDFLSYDWGNMKFDVVLGNPPYQNGNEKGGKSSLWRQFVSSSWNLVSLSGHMAMVVPRLPNDANDLGHIFVQNQTTHVWSDVSKHFPGIGSTFCAWIVQKTPTQIPTRFMQEQLELVLTTNKLPKNIQALSVIEKFSTYHSKIPVTSSGQYKHTSVADGKDDDYLNSKRSKKLCYKMRRTNGDTKYMWGAVEPDDYAKSKVTLTYSGYPGFTYHTKSDPVGTIGFMSGHVLVKNKQEAESLISLYESTPYKFVRDQLSSGGMRGQKIYEQPLLPLDRVWTDTQVYKSLSLTDVEINLIESMMTT